MKIKLAIFYLVMCVGLCAQDLTNQHKLFNTYGLQYNLNKKSSFSASYTGIGELNNLDFTYHDIGLNYTKNVSSNSNMSIGADLIKIKQRDDATFANYYRGNIEYGHHSRIKKLSITNEGNIEAYFPKFNKFQYRLIYTLDATYRLNFTKWKIRPYSRFKVYYYGNGKYLDYYDDEGSLIAKKSPNDIHRWRWYWGIKMKPHSQLSVVAAYFWNEEFNAGIFSNSNINIYNKDKTRIRYPYNSYGAINISLEYTLKFKKKKKSENEVNNEIN